MNFRAGVCSIFFCSFYLRNSLTPFCSAERGNKLVWGRSTVWNLEQVCIAWHLPAAEKSCHVEGLGQHNCSCQWHILESHFWISISKLKFEGEIVMGDEETWRDYTPLGFKGKGFFLLLFLWAENPKYPWWGAVEGAMVLRSSGACGVHMTCSQMARACTPFSGLCLNCSITWFSRGMQASSVLSWEAWDEILTVCSVFVFCRGCIAFLSSFSAGSHAFGIGSSLCGTIMQSLFETLCSWLLFERQHCCALVTPTCSSKLLVNPGFSVGAGSK